MGIEENENGETGLSAVPLGFKNKYKRMDSQLTERKYVLACAIFASLNSVLLGYDVGVMSGAIIFIHEDLKITEVQEEVLVGILSVVSIFGSLAGGRTSDFIGRKWTMALAALVFQTVGILPSISLVLHFFIIPESPRWLVMQNRVDEARSVLLKTNENQTWKKARALYQHYWNDLSAYSVWESVSLYSGKDRIGIAFAILSVCGNVASSLLELVCLLGFDIRNLSSTVAKLKHQRLGLWVTGSAVALIAMSFSSVSDANFIWWNLLHLSGNIGSFWCVCLQTCSGNQGKSLDRLSCFLRLMSMDGKGRQVELGDVEHLVQKE
ncbi:hypothetical protein M0R45_015830 [Rubus argutus]|uniref:Major facilitator superfamily (MFS) profile domain-containing protein n=1 Tax=Rubus argutus TaxID=59490 RepID=A0AAW1XUH4_RUBAR